MTAKLPKPYYEEPGIVIYCADCRDILPLLPDKSVDLVLTDPPYGIGWSRATWADDPSEYAALMYWFVSESARVVSDGWVFVFQSMQNVGHFHEWFPEGFRLYAACKNFAHIRPTGIWHSWDPVVFWPIGESVRNRNGRGVNTNRDYFIGNVAGLLSVKVEHPSPKPVDTLRHMVSIGSLPESCILDPFMGSGTTLVAAKQLGRKAIGIEIEEKYCAIAVKRLAQEQLPFAECEQKPVAEQGTLL